MSQVKIVATIGPKTDNVDALAALREAGMDMARLNGSYADTGWHKRAIEIIRREDSNIPVLLDLPGRKIRIFNLDHEFAIALGQQVTFSPHKSDPALMKVAVNHTDLYRDVHVGDNIVMDDGSLSLTVEEIIGQEVVCQTNQAGTIRNGQGIHLPSLNSRIPFLSQRDREMINFAASQDVDFVGISFVDTASDVAAVRELIGDRGPRIVSKIETRLALENLSELIEVSDALMIDRGDLSVDTQPETIALLQKHILAEAGQAACPVIVATEILQSMVTNPSATKAEISDITNSVLDGATALMLSAETTVGDFPIDAVSTMRSVADVVAESMRGSANSDSRHRDENISLAIGDAIASICRHLEITKIVAVTMSGYAARVVAAMMPRQPILAVSNDPNAARSFNLLRGTKGVHVDIPFSRTNLDHIHRCLEELWRRGELEDEDLVLVTAVSYPKTGNRMNLIETHQVADLRDNFGWAAKTETTAN